MIGAAALARLARTATASSCRSGLRPVGLDQADDFTKRHLRFENCCVRYSLNGMFIAMAEPSGQPDTNLVEPVGSDELNS